MVLLVKDLLLIKLLVITVVVFVLLPPGGTSAAAVTAPAVAAAVACANPSCTLPNDDKLLRTEGDLCILLLLLFDCPPIEPKLGNEGTDGIDFMLCIDGMDGMD